MKQFLLLSIGTLFLLLSTTIKVSAQTVYVTETGTKFHVSTCQHLKKSKIAMSTLDAKKRGYTACSVCRPSVSTGTPSGSATTQCTGTTKSGSRCKRMTTNSSGRCHQH
ncbi:MAG: hypothetical protein QNK23_13660 [Crocinitomicaceae bacterium]|nr:hypothetical protein [Crocinitomicaceae bacterium]